MDDECAIMVGIMPELPEVETVRRGLKPFILNKKIVQVKPELGKCFQGDVKDIEGATVTEIRRYGKALVLSLIHISEPTRR